MNVDDPREVLKEDLLHVAQRVQSEYSFQCVTLGTIQQEDANGLATTEEYVLYIRYLFGV